MRLINVHTMALEEHLGDGLALPKYAILSHTWHSEEVTFLDYQRGASKMTGYRKIRYLCEEAKCNNLKYAWVDTCCIDKTSSSELSEAINSMYNWYRWAQICYVYLDDADDKGKFFPLCRWFKRGWTLQELLAPENVSFYSYNWEYLGSKHTLAKEIATTTKIPILALLRREYISAYSIATKMSWAAGRRTTRTEDIAYSLLGIFGVNMPLLYGEGEKAFIRLQEELIKMSDDESVFAWSGTGTLKQGILADSPLQFLGSGDVGVAKFYHSNFSEAFKDYWHPPKQDLVHQQIRQKEPSVLTKIGLRIEMPLILKKDFNDEALRLDIHGPDALGILNCCRSSDAFGSYSALPLLETTIAGIYTRGQDGPITVSHEEASLAQVRLIYIQGPQPASQYPLYWCDILILGPVYCTVSPIHNISFALWDPIRLRAEATTLILRQTKVSMEFFCRIPAVGSCFLLILELDLRTNKQTINLYPKPDEENPEHWLTQYEETPRDLYGEGNTELCISASEQGADTLCWWYEAKNSVLVLSCWLVDPYQVIIRSQIVSQDDPYFTTLKSKVSQPAFVGSVACPERGCNQKPGYRVEDGRRVRREPQGHTHKELKGKSLHKIIRTNSGTKRNPNGKGKSRLSRP